MMNAWRVHHHGGIEQLQREQIPEPVPGSGEVRVRVQAVGLNHLDIWVRKGVVGHAFPLPMIPGCDVVGVIDSFGPLVTEDSHWLASQGMVPGSRIIIDPTLSCGRCLYCHGDEPMLCKNFGILGETRDGGCADWIIVPIRNLVSLPAAIQVEEAAALPIAFVTAWSMLTRRARLKPEEWVLVQAAGSGVSSAAIQIAKYLGAKVIAVTGSASKMEMTKKLGADHVILSSEGALKTALREILKDTGKRGVDVVIDHVGEKTFLESLKSLDWGGRLVTCGATSGSQVMLPLNPVFFKSLSILGSTMGSRKDLIAVLDLVKQGMIRAVVDRVLPMDKLPEAHQLIESRGIFGKVVVVQARS